MIKITRSTSGTAGTTRLRVEGRIVAKTVGEVEIVCLAALEEGAPLLLDLAGVSYVDATGVQAIQALTARGAVVVGCSALVAELMRAYAERHDEPSSEDETALVAALRRGDPTALESWVRRDGPGMLAAARRLLGVEEEARAVVQEAFGQAFNAIDGVRGEGTLSTWLQRVVVAAALTRLRRQRRTPEDAIAALLPHFDEAGAWGESPASWVTPVDRTEQAGTRALVRECIQELPKSYRTVLVLRDIEELGVDEAAAALGTSAGAVQTRLHHARQALRTLLAQRLGGNAARMPARNATAPARASGCARVDSVPE